MSGRGLMIGALRAEGADPGEVFAGIGHGPAPLSPEEEVLPPPLESAPEPVRHDCPDWLWPLAEEALGPLRSEVFTLLQARAPVFLRVNLARTTREKAIALLAEETIQAEPAPLSPSALMVTGNPRRIQASAAYRDGLVELQDAASQGVVDLVLPFAEGKSVLDYCAGGGGKALHLAAGGAARVVAHDGDPGRMRDIPARAARAGQRIEIAPTVSGLFDCVITDVPCSGSGAWRRQPEAKWRLTEERLADLVALQASILEKARGFVRPGGVLAYATCSFLEAENARQIAAFRSRNPSWSLLCQHQFTPVDGGDGFFVAILRES
jgi:16S rRNA (cytosine967-C5)-methyltransferase